MVSLQEERRGELAVKIDVAPDREVVDVVLVEQCGEDVEQPEEEVHTALVEEVAFAGEIMRLARKQLILRLRTAGTIPTTEHPHILAIFTLLVSLVFKSLTAFYQLAHSIFSSFSFRWPLCSPSPSLLTCKRINNPELP